MRRRSFVSAGSYPKFGDQGREQGSTRNPVNWTDRKLYWPYRDNVTPHIQGRLQMQALGLQRIELEAIRLSYDEILVISGDEFAFSRAADGGGMVER